MKNRSKTNLPVQDLVHALAKSFGIGFFSKREERVLGLRIAHDCTLAETAQIVSRMEAFPNRPITRERVRQIENKAMRKWKARHVIHLCPHCDKESISANAPTGGSGAPATGMKRWTAEETRALQNLYESGDKACLPWNQIPDRLNEDFGNGRTRAACQRKLYVEADKMRRARGWVEPNAESEALT